MSNDQQPKASQTSGPTKIEEHGAVVDAAVQIVGSGVGGAVSAAVAGKISKKK